MTLLIKTCIEPRIMCRHVVGVHESKENGVERYKCVLDYQGCYNKVPQGGWPEQQKFTSSQFWKLESKVKVLLAGVAPTEASSCPADGSSPPCAFASSSLCLPLCPTPALLD